MDLKTISALFDPTTRALESFPTLENVYWVTHLTNAIDCKPFMASHTLEAFKAEDLVQDFDTLLMLTEAADQGIRLASSQDRVASYYLDVHLYTCSM